MATQIIPLTTSPNQSLDVSLSINDTTRTLKLEILYNAQAEYWVVSIIDKDTGEYIVTQIPLLTGSYPAANILQQYAYLGIGSACLVNAGNVAMDHPDDTNLGTDFVLIWSDN